jgi:hypothetical protein
MTNAAVSPGEDPPGEDALSAGPFFQSYPLSLEGRAYPRGDNMKRFIRLAAVVAAFQFIVCVLPIEAAICDAGDPPVCCDVLHGCPYPCSDGTSIPCPPKPKPNSQESGQCPASPGDIEGQIQCGELSCSRYTLNAWNMAGGCYARPGFLCCFKTQMHSRESAVEWPMTIAMRPNGNLFNGKTGPVNVFSMKTGSLLQEGFYFAATPARAAEFVWADGRTASVAQECK